MKKQIITQDSPSAVHIMSQAIQSGTTLYVSGQVHASSDGILKDGTVTEKLDRIMSNIKAILTAGGYEFDDIVKVVMYVTDMAQIPELNLAYPKYFNVPYPVREAVCVAALPLGATIEISVVAAKG